MFNNCSLGEVSISGNHAEELYIYYERGNGTSLNCIGWRLKIGRILGRVVVGIPKKKKKLICFCIIMNSWSLGVLKQNSKICK